MHKIQPTPGLYKILCRPLAPFRLFSLEYSQDHFFSFSLFSNIKGKALQKCCSPLFVALKFFNFENAHLRWKQLESTVGSESDLKRVQQCTIAATKYGLNSIEQVMIGDIFRWFYVHPLTSTSRWYNLMNCRINSVFSNPLNPLS